MCLASEADALSTAGHDSLLWQALSAVSNGVGQSCYQDILGKSVLLDQQFAEFSYTVLTGGLVPILLKTGGSSLCYTSS